MADNTRVKTGTLLEVAALGPAIFAAVNPSFFTVRQFSASQESAHDIRIGEVIGGGLVLLLGFGASLSIETSNGGKDWWPFIISLLETGLMVTMYEYALRSPRKGKTDIVTQQPVPPGDIAVMVNNEPLYVQTYSDLSLSRLGVSA